MPTTFKDWCYFCRYIILSYLNNQYLYSAAALTFSSLLSIVPFLTVTITVLSALPVFKTFIAQIEHVIFTHFFALPTSTTQTYLQDIVEHAVHLSGVSLLFLLLVAIQMIFTIEQTLNNIWNSKKKRNFFTAIILYWALLTLGPILMGTGFIISSFVASHPVMNYFALTSNLLKILIQCLPFLLCIITFTLLYTVVPNCYVPLKNGFFAGLIAAILFECAKNGFAIYIKYFTNYELLYGSLAAIPIFLLWVYISWCIVLLGAVLSKAFTIPYSYKPGIKHNGFIQAFLWLGYFWEAHQQGLSLSIKTLLARDANNYQYSPFIMLQYLEDLQLIKAVSEHEYILNRSLDNYTLEEFYRSLPWQLPNTSELADLSIPWHTKLKQVLATAEKNLHQHLDISLADFYTK